MELNKPLLLISFFTSIRGNCPAEWADDKIRVLDSAGLETIVITGMGSHVKNRNRVRFIRVPSISWNDYKEEVKELKKGGECVPLAMYLFLPFAFVIGSIIDYILIKVTKGVTAGRWSWLLTALPVALWIKINFKIQKVFCTGGPMSAHLLGGLIVRLTGGDLYCEFQDPLLGATMIRSKMTRIIASTLERWIAKRSIKVVYVTQEAARLARERNPNYAEKIFGVYPGAWQFLPSVSKSKHVRTDFFEFLHLGTLYGSRNLDFFFVALDALHEEGFELARSVRVVNLGAVYSETEHKYLARSDFRSLDALDRLDALNRAMQASCLMLVQHTDERSRETIPYKTYDYLNLGLPIFGLLNNDELQTLIESCGGHAAQANNLESIKTNLRNCLIALDDENKDKCKVVKTFDITKQFLHVLEISDAGS